MFQALLREKELVEFDMFTLVAGAKYRGEFEGPLEERGKRGGQV